MSKATWSLVPVMAAFLVAAGLLVLGIVMTAPADATTAATPELVLDEAVLPTVTAASVAVLDVATGRIIADKDASTVRPIASVTKLFTAAALFELTHFTGETTITAADVATEGRAGKLVAGQAYPYHELAAAMLLESSNDAAAAVLRAEPDVQTWMNSFGAQVGDGTLKFADTSGLSAKNTASAADLARATVHLFQSVPHVFALSTQEEIVGTYTGWKNNDPLATLDDFMGGKHGYTVAAGRTASVVLRKNIDGLERDFVLVLLGSENLKNDTEQLVDYIGKHVHLR